MINIYDMTLLDLELIYNNLMERFDDFWKPETLKSELLNENSQYIVAKNDLDEILGFAGIWKAVDDVHITNIVVRKDSRNQGIGSLLLEKLLEISKKNYDITSITLEVKDINVSAIELYLKYGFKKVGIRKNYYNNTHDAIIMTLYLC